MIFSSITKWRVDRLLKKQHDGRFRSFEETGRVVLLAQERGLTSLLPVIQELVKGGIKVTLVVEAKHKNNLPVAIPGCFPILVLRTCWLLNRPTNEFLRCFDNNDGDVLIDVSTTGSLPLSYLAVRSKASFKIGVPKGEENPFQLQILMTGTPPGHEAEKTATPPVKSEPDAGELLHNALFYWKKIGAKENNL